MGYDLEKVKTTRKVQKVGKSTLSISLPKKWAEENEVGKGNLLLLKEEGKVLQITPVKSGETKKQEITVNLDLINDPIFLKRVVLALYAEGREKIKLISSKRIEGGNLKIIREVQKEFVGLTILKESQKEITLEVLTQPEKYTFPELIKQFRTLISTMHREITQALIKEDKPLAKSVLERGKEGERIKNLMYQKVNTQKNIKKLMYNQLFVKSAELILSYENKIARRVIRIIKRGGSLNTEIKDTLAELSEKVLDLYLNVTKDFTKLNPEFFRINRELKEEIEEREQEVLSSLPGKVERELLIPLRFILWGYRRIAEHSYSIASVVIKKTVQSVEGYDDLDFISEI